MEQPDEDDYGFVSEAASAYHNKIMEKYYSKPEEKKFSDRIKNVNNDLTGIKDRVRAAIEREKEEALLPHKRHRKTKAEMAALNGDDSGLNFGRSVLADCYSNEPEKKLEVVKPKPKRPPMPPPLDYTQLLKIAEQKKDEPIKIEPKIEKKEPERLMTSKERREFEEMQARKQGRKQRDLDRLQAMKNKSKGASSSKSSEEQKPKPVVNNPSGRIPKLNGYKPKPEADRQSKPLPNDPQMRPKPSQISKPSLNNSNTKPMTNGSAKSAPQKQIAEPRSSVKSSTQKLNGDVRSSDKLQSKPRTADSLNKSKELPQKSRPEVASRPVNGDSKPKIASKGTITFFLY